ncbi:MAG: ATP-binding protein [Crocinitomicaceae bacterium]|nr:ATP-binding protein [Crocinitomicaceae bacterium]
MNLLNRVEELLQESIQMNINDVLVHISGENKKLHFHDGQLNFKLDYFPKKILLDAKKFKKESGVNSLCTTDGIVKHQINNKTVQTPIFITPLESNLNKIKGEITFSKIEVEEFINPFLIRLIENSASDFNLTKENTKEETFEKLREIGFAIDKAVQSIGNFHHHRYFIIKELEEIISLKKSPNLAEIFGGYVENNFKSSVLTRKSILNSDVDHDLVFDQVARGHCVIQGPPGTGKSQVLTNLISKLIYSDKSAIVVSEKRVALEVIQKKLSTFNLDKFSFIASANNISRSFLQDLKSTWDFVENSILKTENNLLLSDQYLDKLQMSLDLLSNNKLIGGISFTQFHQLAKRHHLIKHNYTSEVVSIDSFLKSKNSIQSIYDLKLDNVVGYLKPSVISGDQFDHLDEKIEAWKIILSELSEVFEVEQWSSLSTIQKEAVNCQIFENEFYKKYAPIFNIGSRPNKRFLSLRKKHLAAAIELDNIAQNQSHWKVIPSELETNELINAIASSPGYFDRKRLRKRWASIANTSFNSALKTLEKRKEEIESYKRYSKILVDFCDLGIDSPEIEVDSIFLTLNQFSTEQWDELKQIPAHKRRKMTSHHTVIKNLYLDLKAHFNFKNDTNIISFLNQLSIKLGEIISLKKELTSLEESALKSLQGNRSLESYEGQLLQSHFVRFKEQFPAFSNFKIADIKELVIDVQSAYQEEQKSFSNEIESGIISKFKFYHEILNTPARKLSEDQKKLKATLRKGKAILVKEFRKTKSHPSLREMQQSEASIWIKLLKPIWLSNPTQVANCFPLKEAIFDLAIFDEASQIPIQNALGTIHRSTQIVIAGDEHQMGPTSYFKSGEQEPLDILHQANYYWPNVRLKHHYRSQHPSLVEFSNTQFYQSELRAYPAYKAINPLNHYFIEEGRFIDGKNKLEAKAIANQIENRLKFSDNIGIVAFSENQLSAIWSALSNSAQEKLANNIDNNKGFLKSLENVQGDECDHLMISFGYGKNENGDFHMRFGPMNTANGRNRLNVLLTRSKCSIDFFCSVKSSDFKVTDNESINLLKQWILFSEGYDSKEDYLFPFGLNPTIDGNTLTFENIHETITNAKELHTLTTVLINRGWVVQFN